MQPPRIDVNLIPAAETRLLCSTLLAAVKRFYQDPENLKKFEEWDRQQTRTQNETMEVKENV